MTESSKPSLVYRVAPGLLALTRYHFTSDFRHDLLAGVSVAAVAIPVAIAYAVLAGFEPVVGLYSSILPLVAYAIFGTSRHLMVNPDAATCAVVAAAVAPLAGGNAELYWSLSVTLALFSGLFCILASFFRLGALADFLSKPILVGFLNGVAISILLGQIGKLFGFPITSGGIIPRLLEFISKLSLTHVPSLAVGVGAFGVLLLTKRFLPQLPSVLVSMTAAGLAVAILHLNTFGVAILGRVPQGLPSLRLPSFPAEDLPKLIAEAAGLALVLFSSGMLTGRSFAEKHDYEFDADHEFAALGAANIASALSQGFSVTGADSRTAVADSAGGRTQVTGLIAAASIAMVLLFLTKPLQFVPVPALGAALVFASFSLFDVNTLRHIWSVDKTAVGLSVITTLGVVAFGAIQAILLAVILSLAVFVKLVARPKDEVLGKVKGMPGWHCIERHPGAQTISGLVIYRFNSPITFFNSAYFKQRARLMVQSAGPGLEFFVLDAIPIVTIDVTGLYALGDFKAELNRQGITLLVAGRRTELLNWFRETGLYRPEFDESFFVTLQQAIEACRPEILHQPFLHARFGLGDDVLKPYKETLDRWLWPDVLRNQHTSVVKAKQAISSYRKAVGAPVGLAELMVFYCEHAAQFCSYIGYQDESYFDALVGMFEQALEVSAQLPASERKVLITRLDKVRVISHNFGYGVGDDMDCVLAKYVRK